MRTPVREQAALRADGKQKCSRCRKVKPFAEFNRNASCSSGYRRDCRDCQRERKRLLLKDPDYVADFNAKRKERRQRRKENAPAARKQRGQVNRQS